MLPNLVTITTKRETKCLPFIIYLMSHLGIQISVLLKNLWGLNDDTNLKYC